jgi:hypothetical protein
MSVKGRLLYHEDFGGGKLPALSSGPGGSHLVRQLATGTPVIQSSGERLELALAATNEAEVARVFMGDNLMFRAWNIRWAEVRAALVTPLGATASLAFGFGSAVNNTLSDITYHTMFRVNGTGNLLIETDDNVNDLSYDSGKAMPTTPKMFVFDFATGLVYVSPPGVSRGGLGAAKFMMEDSENNLRQLCPQRDFNVSQWPTFEASAANGKCQFFAQIQKTASTDLGTLALYSIDVYGVEANS